MRHCGPCIIKPTDLQLMLLCVGCHRKGLICLGVCVRLNQRAEVLHKGRKYSEHCFGDTGIYLLGLQAVNDGSDSSSVYKRLKFSLAQGSIPQDPLPLWAGD